MTQVKLSASSVAAAKACPTRFRYGYVEHLKVADEPETRRRGTSWHGLQETYHEALKDGACPEAAFAAAIGWINERYAETPVSKDRTEWAVEREILVASFVGWLWVYANEPLKTLATEIKFSLPLYHPKIGLPLPSEEVVRVGKIDRLVEHNGRRLQMEYKSTSKSVAPESTYWDRLRMDTQISFYALAARDAGEEVSGTLYDVWRVPQIRPKKLSKSETTAFLNLGRYCGAEFQVAGGQAESGDLFLVNGEETTLEAGAIRETPQMFGARLVQDIYERPEHYFARREIARTDADLKRFEQELYGIYQTMRHWDRTGHYWRNETQCEATFRCDYCPICYSGGDPTDGSTPAGFVRVESVTISLENDL